LFPANGEVGKRYQQATGRGATALWAALEAIAFRDGKRGEIILPDLVCHSVLEAVLAAGFTARLADVSPETYCLTPETIRPHLSPKTSAIIVVHLFGRVAPIEAIAQQAKHWHVWLIEDAVQGIGGHSESGRAVGSFGDFAFLSFHESKTIRGRGGLLLYDDAAWAEPVCRALRPDLQKEYSPSDQLLQTSLRDLYHGLGQAVRQGKLPETQAARTFRYALPGYRSLLFRAFDDRSENLDLILNDWHDLPKRMARRNELASSLHNALSDLLEALPPIENGDAIWRYSVRFPSRTAANRFVVTLRQRGGAVSQLYYPLHQLYQPDLQLQTKSLAPCLVNLWVDESIGEWYVRLVRETALETFGTGD
jgi:dTDP-4-amino-4,6-dideoxygalactose transaminase